jgi:two-component system, NtrC family, nitrogen regulation sensor histidine kinase NtrY
VTQRTRPSRVWLWFSGSLVTILLAAVFTLGSLGLPVTPDTRNEVIVLFAVSTFVVAALVIFGLMLVRTVLRLKAQQLGARFRTKMVVGAMAISLLPVVFMFVISYGLVNRTLSKWFPQPLELAARESQKLINELGKREHERLNEYAKSAANTLGPNPTSDQVKDLFDRMQPGVDALIVLDAGGHARAVAADFPLSQSDPGGVDRKRPSGAEVWKAGNVYSSVGRAALGDGSVLVLRQTTQEALDRPARIQAQLDDYDQRSKSYRAFKNLVLLTLSFFTLALLVSLSWVALFLSKQVTVPIQALAEGTREISRGNFQHRVDVDTEDELGMLVQSFNNMTAQLADSRQQIDDFTRNLQIALQEIETRRKLLETVLESIPTGVISLDAEGRVVTLNSSAYRLFGDSAHDAHTLDDLVGKEASDEFRALLRRALRIGTISKAIELRAKGRVAHAAVTVSALGARSANSGYVVVVDDLTDLLRAQKLAAWQEVAQRIAHEIKNPLTPIQISAERLGRFLVRNRTDSTSATRDLELEKVVAECSTSIGREVETLKSLVDEFSRFVRFPHARLALADANMIAADALDIFRGRLDGIKIHTDFAVDLPPMRADNELLRSVLVNLIDNAAEALEGSPAKELLVATRTASQGSALEIIVADTGRGISPDDKDKLFLPHFSTKDRGTGLGLAIAARVAAEHHGSIRVEDNSPVGSRFILRLPAAEVTPAPVASGSLKL